MKASETSVAGERARLADLVEQLGDRYKVTGKLGLGAFGEVYQAQDRMLDRTVAIKRIRIDAFEDERQQDQVRKRSILEAQLAAGLNHPKIVTIHDILARPSATFIVMEYVKGRTLSDVIKERTRLSLGETIEILSQAAEALDYAHRKKIIHRDVKPGNIMVGADGSVKVMDFGIAKSEASGNLTAVGAILGTPNYMSPEQAEGLSTLDHRTDLFSLGAIAFECLSGQKAFRAESAVGILLRVVKGDTPHLDCDALELHPDADKVLNRALAKDPAERFSSGAELMETLRRVPVTKVKSVVVERVARPVITRREPGSTSSFDLELRGALQEKPLCQVIREIYTTRKTGILHVESESVARRLYFRKGSMVFANSDREQDRLGEFLIARGDIDRTLFERASKLMLERGQRFGRTLVELGAMTDEQMQASVLAQSEKIIRDVFSLRSGKFGFEKMDQPVEQDIVLDISTGDTILRSIRDTVAFDVVRKELGDLSSVLKLSENPLLRYQTIGLEPSEGFVLSRVDGTCSIGELVSLSPLGEEETLKCVYGLISAGVLDVEEPGANRPSRPSPSKQSVLEPEGGDRASAVDIDQGEHAEKEGATDPEAEDVATLDDIAAKHAKLASASYYELLEVDPEATAAGIKAAYHSMVKRYHPDRHHSVKLRQARGLLEELFVKISAAYDVLSDESARADYDGEKLLQKIELQESVAPTKAPRAMHPKLLAAEHYDSARKSYDNMAYYDAIQFLHEAVRLDSTEAAYHKLLGMALSKNPLWREDAAESFLKAVELNPGDIDGYLRLAEIYERSGSETRAQDMYRKVLDYDPANETALKNLLEDASAEYNLVDRLHSVLER